MANILDFGGVRVLTSNAQPGAGYVAKFYASGTTTPIVVSSPDGTPLGTSVTADASGWFPAVTAEASAVKCVIEDAGGATIRTIDPVLAVSAVGAGAEDIVFTPTVELPFTNVQDAIVGAAESAASGYASFGIGITGNAEVLANLDATNIGAGTYRFDGTTIGTFPTGVTAANTGLVEHWRQAGATAMQFLYHATTDRIFHRRMASSVWGAWRENITTNQGAVEGDLIFRGASAWTRLAKGTAGQGLSMNAAATAPAWADGARVLLASKTASASATLDFTEFNNAVYRYYEFELENVKPATDAVDLVMRLSTDGGATYSAGASDYSVTGVAGNSGGGGLAQHAAAGTLWMNLTSGNNVGNAVGETGVTGRVRLYNAGNSSAYTRAITEILSDNTSCGITFYRIDSRRNALQDTDALRFFMTSGPLASGVIRMYGLT